MSNPSGSVDKRDAMRLHWNTAKILHKKIEETFTGLGFIDIAKMQRY